MKDRLCVALVFLVLFVTLNQAEETKINERRAYGMLAHPRIGRHLAMASFARPDGNAGMVNYPRVGRSGSFASMTNADRVAPREFDLDPRIDADRDSDSGIQEDLDYQILSTLSGHRPVDFEESRKRFEALRNGASWLGAPAQGGQAKDHYRMNRCNQQIDGPWAVLFATRDLASLDQQPVHNFIPRMAREVERAAAPTNSGSS